MTASAPAGFPLCVDLDGTLTPIDTLHETLLGLAKQSPSSLLALPGWVAQGKATFKREVSARAEIDVSSLPYREDLLAWLREQRAAGRPLILATAAHRSIADAVAAHLGIFDEVIAADGGDNLSGERKRAALVARYGEKGFDYAGNDTVDLKVWSSARQAIVVAGPGLADAASQVTELGPVFPALRSSPKLWIKAMRIYQWVKNLLIFVPALLAHKVLDGAVLGNSLLAFVAFGLCASSVYLFNDLLDLSSDRRHKRKRHRPFASGALPASRGVMVAGGLFVAALVIALKVGWQFVAVLGAYYVFTWAYSLRFKRAAIVDVMMLAGLYTIRIIAGGAASGVTVSFWLLAFSIFLFLSLAVVKRYAELDDAARAGKGKAAGRGYTADDLPLLMSLGTASGYAAIVVMALYINSPESAALYADSKPLWLVPPLMLYWISRVWLLTTRGQMHDDPILFAIRDRISIAVIAMIGAIVAFAI